MAQSFVKCEICDKRKCALVCIDCDQYFCQECKEGHIKTKTTKDHTFLDSETFQPQFKKLRCTQHEQHFIFFCEKCQTLVCPVCLPENHQEHRMLKIDEVASMKKNVLNESIKTFFTKLNEFQEEVNSMKNKMEKCQRENKDVIQHVNKQAENISNVLENQRRCIIASVKQKAKTEEERISIIVEDLQHCIKEAKEIERKVKLDLNGSDTSLLSNFQLIMSKVDTFKFKDTTISTCPVQFEKYNVPKEELLLLESVFSGNLCGLSEHEERNTLKSLMSKHDVNIEELQKELTNQIQIRSHATNELTSQLKQMQKTILDLQRMNAQQKGLIQNQKEVISAVRCKNELQTSNSKRIPIETVTDVEELSVYSEKNLNIDDQSREASVSPMVNNEDVVEADFVNVIYPNEEEERNKKALEEECNILKHHIKELTEIIADKDISLSLYKDEKEYIMSTSKRLNKVVMATIKNTSSIDFIKENTFPQTGNEFKDFVARVFDSVIKGVEQLKHDFALYNDEARRNEIKIKELQSSNNDLRNQCGKLHQQATRLQKSLERERQQSNLVQENAELKTRLKQIDKWIKQQNYNTENYTSTIEQLHLQVSKIGKDLQSVKSEKDDLQTRLSSMAGEKLTKGNPSITDLGDPNRPMKIGEKYGELYDNEWTDAMESVESIQNCFPGLKNAEQEEIVIHHMYRLLMCCFRECRNISMKQIQNIGQKVAEAMCLNIKSEDELFTLPGCKEVQIYRRQNSEGFANYLVKSQIICKDVLENWDYGHKSEIVLQELITTHFFHKCVHICWCMAIQDPLMYLAEHLPPDTKFDKNEYKEFVKSGDKVKFMVWPALYLHKDGPLLHKGVVQAYW